MRDSLVFYRSFYEAVKDLPAEEFKEAVSAIMEYGLNDEEQAPSGAAKVFLIMAKPLIDANNKKHENGKKGAEFGKLGGRPKKETPRKPQENPKETPKKPQENPNRTPNVNVDVNVNENIKESEEKKLRFYPPTLEELKKYIADNKYNVDPERFIDYYTANGWTVGKNRMKDWKAVVRNWDRSQKSGGRMRQELTAETKFSNFEQRSYDYAALETMLGGANEQTE